MVRVLGCKEPEVGMALERLAELRDVHLATMVQTRVQALQNGLRCEVHLVKKNPFAALHGAQERSVTPGEVTRLGTIHWYVCAKQVHEVGLVGQVDSCKWSATDLGQCRDKSGLSDTGAAFEQDWLLHLQSASDSEGVETGSRGPEKGERLLIDI